MNNQNRKKTLSYILALKKRVEKLRKGIDDWEVRPHISKKIKKIDTNSKILGKIIKISSKPELTYKEKKELIRLTKRRLISLKRHFLSVYKIIQKNPTIIYDKKIKDTEKELEECLALYEKAVSLLFWKKSKKK